MRFSDYSSKTPDSYLATIKPAVLQSFSTEQLAEFRRVLDEAIPKPSPKLVDLRFAIDLIVQRFYVVLFIGKDRRKKERIYLPSRIARIGNRIVIVIFLFGANLAISGMIVLAAYLFKTLMGFDFLPGHFPDVVKQIFGLLS